MKRNEMIEMIWNDEAINEAIKNIVSKSCQEDFKAHFIEQIINTSEDKLNELHKKNELIYFAVKVITNQWRSNSSSFWKIYRNNGSPRKTKEKLINGQIQLSENPEEIYATINGQKVICTNDYEVDDINPEETIAKIKLLLLEQYDEFLVNQYHKTLFELYHFKKLKLKEIQDITGINMKTVSKSVIKTRLWLKTKLEK